MCILLTYSVAYSAYIYTIRQLQNLVMNIAVYHCKIMQHGIVQMQLLCMQHSTQQEVLIGW